MDHRKIIRRDCTIFEGANARFLPLKGEGFWPLGDSLKLDIKTYGDDSNPIAAIFWGTTAQVYILGDPPIPLGIPGIVEWGVRDGGRWRTGPVVGVCIDGEPLFTNSYSEIVAFMVSFCLPRCADIGKLVTAVLPPWLKQFEMAAAERNVIFQGRDGDDLPPAEYLPRS